MTSEPSGRRSALYRRLWRWHFYAGLFCIPFVLTLAASGAIYLFKPQVEQWLDAPYRELPVSGPLASPQQQIDAALASLPGSRLINYELPLEPNDAVKIAVGLHGIKHLVYVHPETLRILKQIEYEAQFMRQVRAFHGELLAGNVGSVLVELAACWAIVLILTGLYLWWPRHSVGLAGVLYPRLRQGRRVLWRDLHAVTGIWISAFALFLLLTGLPWALVWGSAFKEVRQWGQPTLQQDWSVGHSEHHAHSAAPKTMPVLSTEVMARAVDLNFAPPAELSPDKQQAGVWKLTSQSQNRPLRAEAWIDGRSGRLLSSRHFDERPLVDRAIGIGVAAHEGQLFGWFNQLLGVLTAVGLMIMATSGFVLWRRRKPAQRLGAPSFPAEHRLAVGVTVMILGLALVLPVVGMSLVCMALMEFALLRHIPAARRWLGLPTR